MTVFTEQLYINYHLILEALFKTLLFSLSSEMLKAEKMLLLTLYKKRKKEKEKEKNAEKTVS